METANKNDAYTLSEIEGRLKVEQHRLIHLCEKGVITPDYEDASGRGTVRRFSERNLFEFAVALELRRFFLPIAYIAPIIRVLEAFEAYAAKKIKVFSLPESLQNKSAIGLRIIIAEGRYLYFALKQKKETSFIGSLDLSKGNIQKNALSGIKSFSHDPTTGASSRFEIDLTKIAQGLQ